MDNTKLAEQLRAVMRERQPYTLNADEVAILDQAADALEAAEAEVQRGLEMWSAEVTRGDLATIRAVQAEAELKDLRELVEEDNGIIRMLRRHRDEADAEVVHLRELTVLAAAPVSLEAVKAETTTDWEYGVTYVDPKRPVSFATSMEKAVESKAFYDGLRAAHPSTYREQAPSMILRRTPGVAPGPWLPVETEGDDRG